MATLTQAWNLALTHHQAGRLAVAEELYRRILQVEPGAAEVCLQLGLALQGQGRMEEAATCYQRATELKPDLVEAHYDWGNLLRAGGRPDLAVERFRRALALQPDLAEAHMALGNALLDLGHPQEAVAAYRRAVQSRPDYAEAYNNLGVALQGLGLLDEAEQCHRHAVVLRPDYAEAYNNLGQALQGQARLDEAIDCFGHAVELRPEAPSLHSNLVYALHFSPRHDGLAIGQEVRRWHQRHAAPLIAAVARHANDRSPDRRLRVGYVSADFRTHPVGRFLLPLVEAHDRRQVEVFCYASVRVPDELTTRFQASADVWRDATRLSDEQLAAGIREDRIDVLVDLSMHMLGNRLLTFARRPAPVQVSYLAYCGTTGLEAIDYRLTDSYLDPPGEDESCYAEQTVRLPGCYWCYRPVADSPLANEPPSLASGRVTFGCLNNFCKVSPQTLDAWGRLLAVVPASRLLLHAHAGSHRDRVRETLAARGVDSARVEFVDLRPTLEYFALYRQIDVALDPFPYGGGTTTCDALWMGVPVVSLVGRTAVGRAGLSILSNLGLADLVAGDVEQYVGIAARLATDSQRLGELRSTLRTRMLSSALMDAPRFARNMEQAFREMWRRWCSGFEKDSPFTPGPCARGNLPN
jgi:predicted O-linked N-acetylglucosamine transferase (SPINDLY family)